MKEILILTCVCRNDPSISMGKFEHQHKSEGWCLFHAFFSISLLFFFTTHSKNFWAHQKHCASFGSDFPLVSAFKALSANNWRCKWEEEAVRKAFMNEGEQPPNKKQYWMLSLICILQTLAMDLWQCGQQFHKRISGNRRGIFWYHIRFSLTQRKRMFNTMQGMYSFNIPKSKLIERIGWLKKVRSLERRTSTLLRN